jgi:DNA mismatch repair ATPase MutS
MSGTRISNLPETIISFSDSIHEPAVYEDQIKARLQTITTFVEGLNTSTVDLLLAEKPFARELLQELVVKEAALRWIVRVATLSNENVRARLWADIDKALDHLDLIVDLVGRANIEWPVNDVLQFSDELAYIT